MKYVVYHIDSIRYTVFDTQAAAKRSCTAKNKKVNRDNAKRAARYNEPIPAEVTEYAMCDQETFDRDVNYEVDTYSMMDDSVPKKPIKIRRSELGGCCDPASERYWSM